MSYFVVMAIFWGIVFGLWHSLRNKP